MSDPERVDPRLMYELRARMLARYEAERSTINMKAAWCAVVPPLGWFGRANRIEAEHRRLSDNIHFLIRRQVETYAALKDPRP